MSNGPELAAEPLPPVADRAGYSSVVWLNLLCLDAPIVAVAWQWLFAHTFGAHLSLALRALLFLTAWLIYLADRFADTIKLPVEVRFAPPPVLSEHVIGWWVEIVVFFPRLSLPCAASIANDPPRRHARGICGLYLFVIIVRRKVAAVPMKEKDWILSLPAHSRVVGQLPGRTIFRGGGSLRHPLHLTASIAAWERDSTRRRAKVPHDRMADARAPQVDWLPIILPRSFRPFWRSPFALALPRVSAFLLVSSSLGSSPRYSRTALADLVCFTRSSSCSFAPGELRSGRAALSLARALVFGINFSRRGSR